MRAKLRASTKQHLLRAMARDYSAIKGEADPWPMPIMRLRKRELSPGFQPSIAIKGPEHAIGQPDFLVADIKRDAGVRRVRCIHAASAAFTRRSTGCGCVRRPTSSGS